LSKGKSENHFIRARVKVKVLPTPMVHRGAPISVSVALGHVSANALKATVGAGPLVAPRV